jgi:hypothetical protein
MDGDLRSQRLTTRQWHLQEKRGKAAHQPDELEQGMWHCHALLTCCAGALHGEQRHDLLLLKKR